MVAPPPCLPRPASCSGLPRPHVHRHQALVCGPRAGYAGQGPLMRAEGHRTLRPAGRGVPLWGPAPRHSPFMRRDDFDWTILRPICCVRGAPAVLPAAGPLAHRGLEDSSCFVRAGEHGATEPHFLDFSCRRARRRRAVTFWQRTHTTTTTTTTTTRVCPPAERRGEIVVQGKNVPSRRFSSVGGHHRRRASCRRARSPHRGGATAVPSRRIFSGGGAPQSPPPRRRDRCTL